MSSLVDTNTPSRWDDDSGKGPNETREEVSSRPAGRPPSETAGKKHSNPELPSRIGRYQIVRQLGHGGFGLVYLANDPELHRRVAIKVPRWDRPLTPNAVERFLKEGKLLAQIEHPSIVAVHDLGTTGDGVPFVVMQYVEGKTLRRTLESRELELGKVLWLLMQIAIALREAHKQTIVHRDFKPANVIIDSQGHIHLVDFGMALHDDLTLSDFKTKNPAGTPQFMAPEQIRGENHRIDGRTDIWAFGVTMYRMLTGRFPFKNDDPEGLKREICYANPTPLRQLRDTGSRELDRICLRCLSKLMHERYQSMADVIDELKAASGDIGGEALLSDSLDEPFDSRSNSPGWSGSSAHGRPLSVSHGTSGSAGSLSVGEPLYIIPKGLRSFDENDHDFFVQLLPGPTDRTGIPESIRFWVARLGKEFQVEDVPIGIIYGPSGCGKSSFVRAGLIPRLAADVTPVYIDCTTRDIAQTIRDRLQRAPGTLPAAGDLATCLRKLRQRPDDTGWQKVVLVLDQFEQWLETADDHSRREMTEALRQCDTRHIQTLILVRDDYWMSVSDFMRRLEQPLVEGKNAMSLPLFDRRHAERVLVANGRSVGALPVEITPLSRSEKKFVNDAIDSITENGNVLCVRLTILADMIANADWGKTSFSRTFGFDGIGNVFLERHLTDSVKVNRSGWLPTCELILRCLLPPTTQTELKATERKRSELLQTASQERKARHFPECIDYLKNDLKLISAVESEDSPAAADEVGYRLTHDFFVIPIRQWLQRRQCKSLAGRVRSRFSELSIQYQIANNRRYLPGPVEYLLTLLFVRRRNLGETGRDFLRKAHRHHFLRFLAMAVAGIVTVFTVYQAWNFQEAKFMYARLFNGDADAAVELIGEIRENPPVFRDWLIRDAQSDDKLTAIRATATQAVIDPSEPRFLHQLLDEVGHARIGDYRIFEYAATNFSGPIHCELELAFDRYGADLASRSRLAILSLALGDDRLLTRLVDGAVTADPRTSLTDVFTRWHGNLGQICDTLKRATSEDVRFAALEALAFEERDHRQMTIQARTAVESLLNSIHEKTQDPGVFVMLDFVARRWEVELPRHDDERDFLTRPVRLADNATLQLLIFPGGELPLRRPAWRKAAASLDHNQTIPTPEKSIRPFAVSATETTVRMYRSYIESLQESTFPADIERRNRFTSLPWWDAPGQMERPIRELFPSDIFEFLNWLSRENGLDEVYQRIPGRVGKDGYPVYEYRPDRNGFRTPTSYESEWFLRAGSRNSQYSWGANRDENPDLPLLDTHTLERVAFRYGTFESSYFADVRSTAPNRYGIHESQGNVQEFCHDSRTPARLAGDEKRYSVMPGCNSRTLFTIKAWDVEPLIISTQGKNLGFRIARNQPRAATPPAAHE